MAINPADSAQLGVKDVRTAKILGGTADVVLITRDNIKKELLEKGLGRVAGKIPLCMMQRVNN